MIEDVPVMRIAGMLLRGRSKLPGPFQKLAYLLAMLVMSWTVWRYRHCYDVLHIYNLSLLALPMALVCRLTGKALIIAVRSAGSGEIAKSRSNVSLLAGSLN